jgi:FkbM family methyltransferase
MDKVFKYFDKDLNIIETELGYYKRFDLSFRPNTSDKTMIKEGYGDYPTIDFTDKVVFDCGANIGSFSARAMRHGAKSIIAYEPEEFNFAVLEENIGKNPIVNLIRAALINSDEPTISFYLGKSKNSACSGTTNPSKRKIELVVPAINFYSEVEKYKPSVIKLDIEGGEYKILMDYVFPDYVKEVAVELHGMSKEHNKLMYVLDELLQKQFPKIHFHKICEIFKKPMLILGHYSRD